MKGRTTAVAVLVALALEIAESAPATEEPMKSMAEKAGAAAAPADGAAAAPPAAPGESSRAPIRLDAKQRQTLGLTYGRAERRSLEKVIRTVGRFDYDERKIAAVTLKVNGYVKDLFVDYTGKAVRKGDPLFTIYSPDLVSAEQEYLLAVEGRKTLAKSDVPSAAESAASLVRASRDRLKLWDLSERQIRDLEEAGKPSLAQTILSPASGVVLEKMVVAGQSVQAGMTLYRIADLSSIWVYGELYEYELPFVKVGQTAEISLAYGAERTFSARVAYIYPTVDPKTRTVKVRFELKNTEDGGLRPEMYGQVELRVPLGEHLVVPRTALLDSGRRQSVFVASGDGQLVPRDVELGDRVDDFVEVKKGLAEGERVVTSANFLVDSESQLQGAESMMGMMGAIGMGDWKMESARPMSMGDEAEAPPDSMGGMQMAGDGQERKSPAPQPKSIKASPAPNEKRVGELLVSVFPAADTAKVGDSAIRVRIRDGSGAAVTGAKVSFNYTMDMPGMTIESAEAKELGDGVYEGTAKFAMGGPWGLVVQIDRPGKPSLREKFVVRVEK